MNKREEASDSGTSPSVKSDLRPEAPDFKPLVESLQAQTVRASELRRPVTRGVDQTELKPRCNWGTPQTTPTPDPSWQDSQWIAEAKIVRGRLKKPVRELFPLEQRLATGMQRSHDIDRGAQVLLQHHTQDHRYNWSLDASGEDAVPFNRAMEFLLLMPLDKIFLIARKRMTHVRSDTGLSMLLDVVEMLYPSANELMKQEEITTTYIEQFTHLRFPSKRAAAEHVLLLWSMNLTIQWTVSGFV